jgi:hypothetical protein
LPDGLRAIVLKCLAKNRDERFQSVTELASALLPYAQAVTHFAVPAHSSQDALSSAGEQRPPDRPSFRVPGGETSSAWGDTQLATSGPKAKWPLFVGVGASALVAAVAAIVGLEIHASSTSPPRETMKEAPTAIAATATTATVPTATNAPATDVPSSRNLPPPNPLVSPTGGPVRPLPPALGQTKRDASVATTAQAASITAPPPTSTGDDPPAVRH